MTSNAGYKGSFTSATIPRLSTARMERHDNFILPPSNRDARFYQPELPASRIPSSFVTLLRDYSNIPVAEQVSHIVRIRNQAYAAYPYPCLGRFRILDLDLAAHPLYNTVLNILKGHFGTPQDQLSDLTLDESAIPKSSSVTSTRKPLFLDLGTCLGQDIRKLIYDGVSSTQIYGADLNEGFVDFGYALFRDEGSLPRSQFLTGTGCNVLLYPDRELTSYQLKDDANEFKKADLPLASKRLSTSRINSLNDLQDSVDIIHACAIFHLFSLDDQKKVARSCLKLLSKDNKFSQELDSSLTENTDDVSDSGANGGITTATTTTTSIAHCRRLILGAQAGNIIGKESTRRNGTKVYRHNQASWERMWHDIVKDNEWKNLNTKIKVGSRLIERSWVGSSEQSAGQKTENEDEDEGDNQKEGDGKVEWNSKVVGSAEEGFRWHIFWIWVEFGYSSS